MLAKVGAASCRKTDVFARWGGDEFHVYPALPPAAVGVAAPARNYEPGASPLPFSTSRQVSSALRHAAGEHDVEAIPKRADQAQASQLICYGPLLKKVHQTDTILDVPDDRGKFYYPVNVNFRYRDFYRQQGSVEMPPIYETSFIHLPRTNGKLGKPVYGRVGQPRCWPQFCRQILEFGCTGRPLCPCGRNCSAKLSTNSQFRSLLSAGLREAGREVDVTVHDGSSAQA